jgi:hypothetical protein
VMSVGTILAVVAAIWARTTMSSPMARSSGIIEEAAPSWTAGAFDHRHRARIACDCRDARRRDGEVSRGMGGGLMMAASRADAIIRD